MDGYVIKEWLNLFLRWAHIIAGIMWIGQTYLFNWMENRFAASLKADSPKDFAGHLWMVHGGGFYLVEKQKEPAQMPHTLHWFKWESFFTWLSGMLLLIVVYYMGGLMVEADGAVSETYAIILGVATLVLGMVVYNILWYKTPLNRSEPIFAAVSLILLVVLAIFLNRYLSSRAVFLHIGALFGTIMVTNVWMCIMPAQKQMVQAIENGEKPDMNLASKAKQCSKHNTFMSVPVIFLMISSHYPTTTYGHNLNWLILGLLILLGWGAAKIIRDH